MKIYTQTGYSIQETLCARMYGNAQGVHLEDIPNLPKFGWMPVGTVEFCRAAMRHQGITEPEPLDYPDCLAPWLTRHELTSYGALPEGWSPENHGGIHAKPYFTKTPESLWKKDTPFWIGKHHHFIAEWRFYIIGGEIVGSARYDDNDTELALDTSMLNQITRMMRVYQENGAPSGYGMDVGVSEEDGKTYLIEVNDGWALGLYRDMSRREYVRLLEARWLELEDKS